MQKLASLSTLPILGWIMSAFMAILFAIPLHFLWGWLGPVYFAFVPPLYLNMGFIDMAGMLILVGFLKTIFLPSFATTVNNKEPK